MPLIPTGETNTFWFHHRGGEIRGGRKCVYVLQKGVGSLQSKPLKISYCSILCDNTVTVSLTVFSMPVKLDLLKKYIHILILALMITLCYLQRWIRFTTGIHGLYDQQRNGER